MNRFAMFLTQGAVLAAITTPLYVAGVWIYFVFMDYYMRYKFCCCCEYFQTVDTSSRNILDHVLPFVLASPS